MEEHLCERCEEPCDCNATDTDDCYQCSACYGEKMV